MNSDHLSHDALSQADAYAMGTVAGESYIHPVGGAASPSEELSKYGRSLLQPEARGASRPTFLAHDVDTGAIEFRVITNGSPARRLRLTGSRYTFGSAHGCSIQLGDRTLRPMHAVLIRDADRILVRAYSVPIEVNSNRTTEATLKIGDVMRLGNYRFELLSSGRNPVGDQPIADKPIADKLVGHNPVSHNRVKQKTQPGIVVHESLVSINSPRFPEETNRNALASIFSPTSSPSQSNFGKSESVSLLGEMTSMIAAGVYDGLDDSADMPLPEARLQDRRAHDRRTHDRRMQNRRDSDPNSGGTTPAPAFSEDTIWREQLRREVAQWRKRQEDCERRESHCKELEHELRSRESELWSRAENLYKREARLLSEESSVESIQSEVAQKKEEIARLRAENDRHASMYAKRAAEFETLEVHYRRQVDHAAMQLAQSQEQAKAATDAIHRMREQFNSLKDQLETLSYNQEALQREEAEGREEQRRIRIELEQSRTAAIEARSKSEAKRAEAESKRAEAEHRFAEVTSELETLRAHREAEQSAISQSESIAKELRAQIAELQQCVARASEESSELRANYSEARDSVLKLESLLAETGAQHEADRSSWLMEADQLHHSVEALSVELANANRELSELRDANDQLTRRFDELQRERDSVVQELETRPTSEAFDLVSDELGSTAAQLALLRNDLIDRSHEKTDADLANREHAPQSDPIDSLPVVQELVVQELVAQMPVAESSDVHSSDATPAFQYNQEVWPTYETFEVDSESPENDIEAAPPGEQASWSIESADGSIELPVPESASRWAGPSQFPVNSGFDPSLDSSLVVRSEPSSLAKLEDLHPVATKNDELTSSHWGTPSHVYDDPQSHSAPIAHDDEQDLLDDEASHDVTSSQWGTPSHVYDEPQSHSEPISHDYEQESLDDDASHDVTSSQWGTPSHIYDDVYDEPESHSEPISHDDEQDSVEVDASHDVTSSQWGTPSHVYDEPQSHSESALLGLGGELERDDLESELENELQHEPHYGGEGSGSLASQLIRDIEADRLRDHSSDDEVGPSIAIERTSMMEAQDLDNNVAYGGTPGIDDLLAENPQEDYEHTSVYAPPVDSDSPELDSYDAESQVKPKAHGTAEEAEFLSGQSEATQPVSETAVTPSPSEEEDEDSIEAYMNRLLQRVQGESSQRKDGSSATSPSTSSVSVSASQSIPHSASVTASGIASTETVSEFLDPDEPMVPRSQAPEKTSNLSAMRELANQSARTAIIRSTIAQTRDIQRKGMSRFGNALIAAVCAAALVMFTTWFLRYIAAGAILVLAFVFVQEGRSLLAEAKKKRKAAESQAAAEEDSDEISEEEAKAAAEQAAMLEAKLDRATKKP